MIRSYTKHLGFLSLDERTATIVNVRTARAVKSCPRSIGAPQECAVDWAIAWAKDNRYVLDNVDYETKEVV